jgi:hypothetical protein
MTLPSHLKLLLQADFTPLMFCGYHGHTEIAKALIQAGCDKNAQGSVSLFPFLLFLCISLYFRMGGLLCTGRLIGIKLGWLKFSLKLVLTL